MFYRMIQTIKVSDLYTVLSNGKSRYFLVELELGSAIHERFLTYYAIKVRYQLLQLLKIALYSISKYIKKLYALSTLTSPDHKI